MAAIFGTEHYYWGSGELKLSDIKSLPKGRIKLRLRNNGFAKVYVKQWRTITEHFVRKEGNEWVLTEPIGKNQNHG